MTRFSRIIAAAVMAVAVSAPAFAQSAIDIVRDAKDACLIGERIDGYLGVVEGANVTPQIQAAMDEINLRRRARYDELAREQSTSVDVVARLTGESLIERSTDGQCVLDASGAWREL